MKHEIAASTIIGDDVEKDNWKNLTESLVEAGVTKHFVSFNGRGKVPKFVEKTKALPVEISTAEWEDDYGKARNDAFSAIPFDEFEWLLWIDSDDTAHGNLNELIDSLDKRTLGAFLKYDYGIDPATGKVLVEQWRERLLSTRSRWLWQYPIHEVCIGVPNIQYAKRPEEMFRVVHHRYDSNERGARERNRRLIIKARNQYPDEPRFDFYFGNEILAEANNEEHSLEKRIEYFNAAERVYRDYVAKVEWGDDAYVANHRRADCLRSVGKRNEAIDADLQGIKMYPHWPDSYVGISHSYMDAGEWAKAEEWANLCIELTSLPETTQAIEPFEATYTPIMLRGVARWEMGKRKEALEDLTEAHKVWPSEEVEKKIEKLKKEIEEIPPKIELPEFKDNETISITSKPTLAFYTAPHFEPWHTKTEERDGLGGAETAIVRLAPLYAEAGWEVHVFGTPGPYQGIDENGVGWWQSEDYSPTDPYDVLVCSRAPGLFDAPNRAKKKILWMHDVNAALELAPDAGMFNDRLGQIDLVIALSQWHKAHMSRLYPAIANRMVIVGNGISWQNFTEEPVPIEENNYAYASSPDRGLDVLLQLWPEIREHASDAQLNVYYGWNNIDKLIAAGHQHGGRLLKFKEHILNLYEEAGGEKSGVVFHGRIPQKDLASKWYETKLWLYPTSFAETHCITALEAQAAGAVPITSDFAGLKDTVACPELRLSGYPNNFNYQERFMELYKRINDGPREDFIERGRVHAMKHTWEEKFLIWRDLTRERVLV